MLPKGIILNHRSLCNEVKLCSAFMTKAIKSNAPQRFVSWLPFYHDMGLNFFFLPLMVPDSAIINLSTIAFLVDPVTWFEVAKKFNGNVTAAPNFAFELCNKKIPNGYDLSFMALIANGAEAPLKSTVETFKKKFNLKPGTYANTYGMAECVCALGLIQDNEPNFTVNVNITEIHKGRVVFVPENSPNSITIIATCHEFDYENIFRIVDPNTNEECPPLIVGEIWILSDSKCIGYWNKPELNHVFNCKLKNDSGCVHTPFCIRLFCILILFDK